jgi:phosphonatase-like hydrolase
MIGSAPRLVVFDLAGTTMQDDGTVAETFQEVLTADGLTCSAEDIARVRGASKREAFRQLASSAEQSERLFLAFLAALRRRYQDAPPREVQGASEVFSWLREQGTKVALNTGFERAMVELLVRLLGWDPNPFDTLVCGDEVAVGRPSPAMIHESMRRTGTADPRLVMVVGDTVLDLQAGTAAHAGWVVGVTSGAHDHARLLSAPYTHLIASVAHLREVLR